MTAPAPWSRTYPVCGEVGGLLHGASQTLLEFGRNRLDGDLGLTALLHTWGQQLNFHPHLHCIVTGGALRFDGQNWRSPKQRKFLFPVRALAALFRGKFLHSLQALLDKGSLLRLAEGFPTPGPDPGRWFSHLYAQRWVVYAKRPFGGPEQVLAYLGNYTHRVAISNRRILALDPQAQTVTFTWRDYRHGSQVQTCTLSATEFIRRFSWHILPPGLVRIRHYGLLANNRRQRAIAQARKILQRQGRRRPLKPIAHLAALQPLCCPTCGKEALRWIGFVDPRGRLHLKASVPLADSS